ncbi:hypothetical protein G7Y79_00069g096270 [Physcia stellaris]|nr:hypothetical protein G7Y79_00069g096270 [Physcia stellaris]
MESQAVVKEAIPESDERFAVDPSIVAVLPKGAKVTEARSYGKSEWARLARVRVELADGTAKSYFLKCAIKDGERMMKGEYTSMLELYRVLPSLLPKPHAWGRFELEPPETSFFLCDFLDLDLKLPEPDLFCARIAHIHHSSISPNGRFGFHVPNCHGRTPQIVDWDSSWASFFTKLLVGFFDVEREQNGPWLEYEEAFQELVAHVVPQLLGPLQEDRRVLKPCLVHGDLWDGNVAIDRATGEPVVFDAACLYAHNEYELGMWRREEVKFTHEPVEQWDDRNRLYALKFNIAHMIGWPKDTHVRQRIYEDMCFLVNKYLRR